MCKHQRLLAPLLGLLFLAATIPRLDDFGATWDFGQVGYGDRYLHCLLSASTDALEFDAPSPVQWPPPHLDLDRHCTEGPELVWPLGPMASAITCELAFRRFEGLPPLASRHLASLLFTALLLVFLAAYAAKRLGVLEAGLGVSMLALHPTYLWHSFANFKDPPAAAWFVIACILWVEAFENQRLSCILAAGAAWGLALASKGNALFLPVAIALAIPLRYGVVASCRALAERRMVLKLAAGAMLALLLAFALWPWLWQDPLGRLQKHWDAIVRNRSGAGGAFSALKYAWFTCPELMLTGALLSIPWALRREGGVPRMLWALLAVPLLQASWPGTKHYDGIRRYLEFVPPLAMLAGLGLGRALRLLLRGVKNGPGVAARLCACLLLLAPQAWFVQRSHPDEHLYYNLFAGGAVGARERGLDSATDFWAHSYRRVFGWLAEHSASGLIVHTPTGPQVARLSNELWGRPDLTVLGPFAWDVPLSEESTLFIAFVVRPEYYNEIAFYAEAKWQPEFEVRAEGVRLAAVYRVDPGSPRRAELFTVIDFARTRQLDRVLQALQRFEQQKDALSLNLFVSECTRLRGIDSALLEVEKFLTDARFAGVIPLIRATREHLLQNRRFLR